MTRAEFFGWLGAFPLDIRWAWIRLKVRLRESAALWAPVLFWAAADICDDLSSLRPPAGWIETNPYARDVAGHFVLSHALAYDAAWLLIFSAASGTAYLVARRWSEGLARCVWAAPWLWFGYGSLDAALSNVWATIGWYVTAQQVYQNLQK